MWSFVFSYFFESFYIISNSQKKDFFFSNLADPDPPIYQRPSGSFRTGLSESLNHTWNETRIIYVCTCTYFSSYLFERIWHHKDNTAFFFLELHYCVILDIVTNFYSFQNILLITQRIRIFQPINCFITGLRYPKFRFLICVCKLIITLTAHQFHNYNLKKDM